MATADDEDLQQRVGLYTDVERSIQDIFTIQTQNAERDAANSAALQERINALQGTISQAQRNQSLSAEDLQQAQIEQQQAVDFVNSRIISKFDLDADDKVRTRVSGYFDAAVLRGIQREREKLASRNDNLAQQEIRKLTLAEQLYRNDIAAYQQKAQESGVQFTPPEQILENPDIDVDELLTPGGLGGFIRNIGASAAGGLVGVGAIGASALGAEQTGQRLGEIAQGVRQRVGVEDLGSVAAQQEFGEIVQRTQLSEEDPNYLPINQAVVEAVRMGADGDFVGDLLSGTAGALLGGSGVGLAARGAARGLGALGATRSANALNAVGRGNTALNQRTAGAPAVAVGLGSGVDENLTTEEARGLAATTALSAGFGAVAGNTIEGLTVGGQAARGGVLGQAGRTAASEAGQEFIEGAGESLSRSAGQPVQGSPDQRLGLGVFGDSAQAQQARSQALASGAVSAPLGAALGAGVGGVQGAIRDRRVPPGPGSDPQSSPGSTPTPVSPAGPAGVEVPQQGGVSDLGAFQGTDPLRQQVDLREDLPIADQVIGDRFQRAAPIDPLNAPANQFLQAPVETANVDNTLGSTDTEIVRQSLTSILNSAEPVRAVSGLIARSRPDANSLQVRNLAQSFVNAFSDPNTQASPSQLVGSLVQRVGQLADTRQVTGVFGDVSQQGSLDGGQLSQPQGTEFQPPMGGLNVPLAGPETGNLSTQPTLDTPGISQPQGTDLDPPTEGPGLPVAGPSTDTLSTQPALDGGQFTQPQGTEFQPPVGGLNVPLAGPATSNLSTQPTLDTPAISQPEGLDLSEVFAPATQPLDAPSLQTRRTIVGAKLRRAPPTLPDDFPSIDSVNGALVYNTTVFNNTNPFFAELNPQQRKQLVGNRKGKTNPVTIAKSLQELQKRVVRMQALRDKGAKSFDSTKYRNLLDEFNAQLQYQERVINHRLNRGLPDTTPNQTIVDHAQQLEFQEITEENLSNYTNITPANPAFQGLTDSQISELLKNTKSGDSFRGRAKQIRALLKDGVLTDAELQNLFDLVKAQEAAINGKKPSPPAPDGGGGGAAPDVPVTDPEPNPGRWPTGENIDFIAIGRQARTRQSRVPRSAQWVQSPSLSSLLPLDDTQPIGQSFSVTQVEQLVEKLTQNWSAKAKRSISVIDSNADVLINSGLDPRTTGGFTQGAQAYIVADNLASAQQVSDVLTEEVFHRGLMVTLGGSYNNQLVRIYNARGGVDGLLGLARSLSTGRTLEQDYADVVTQARAGERQAQIELTDEVLARIAVSDDIQPSLKTRLRDIYKTIRKYAAQFFGKDTLEAWSDQDLHRLVRQANAAGRTGEAASGVRPVRANRLAPGEYAVTRSDGTVAYVNTGDASTRPSTSRIQDLQNATRELTQRRYNAPNGRWRENLDRLFDNAQNNRYWTAIVRNLANGAEALGRIENVLNRAGRAVASVIVNDVQSGNLLDLERDLLSSFTDEAGRTDLLSIESQSTTVSSKAREDLYRKRVWGDKTFADLFAAQQDQINALAESSGQSVDEVRRTVARYMQAQHTPERQLILWMKNVPLVGVDLENPLTPDEVAIARFRARGDGNGLTRQMVLDAQQAFENQPDFAETAYEDWAFGTGLSLDQAQEIIRNIEGQPEAIAQQYRALAQNYRDVVQATNQVRREQGSFSKSLEKAIDAYGWEFYIPMRGQNNEPDDDLGPTFTANMNENVFSQTFREAEGRSSVTDDTVDVIYKQALGALESLNAQPLLVSVLAHLRAQQNSQTYRSTFLRDGSGGQLFKGLVQELNINGTEFRQEMKTKNPNRLVIYDSNNDNVDEADQRALVITLENTEAAYGLLGRRSQQADQFDEILRSFSIGGKSIHDVTRVMASLKTYRNLPFIPFEAIRTAITFSYATSTISGLSGFSSFVDQVISGRAASDVYTYINLRTQGRFDELQRRVAQAGPNSELAQLDEFFRLGGVANPIAAIRDAESGSIREIATANRETLGDVLSSQRGDRLQRAGSVAFRNTEEFFQTANQWADLVGRFAMYKALRAQGETPQRAASQAKNVANFETRGRYAGPLAGLFEFFNSSAIGGTALINNTLRGPYGPETLAVAIGSGVMLYTVANLMAGRDEDDNDRLGLVNGRLYTNNFIFQYGDDNSERLQIGLGFGPVAWALGSGIQMARAMHGHQGAGESFKNIGAGFNAVASFLPTSSISATGDPTAFGFDTAIPSVIKPMYQSLVNLNSLGLPIRLQGADSMTGNPAASFSGRYGSEGEMYEGIVDALRAVGIDMAPETARHYMRSYLGGVSNIFEAGFENYQALRGDLDGEYSLKKGLYPISQFFGSSYDQLSQDFYEKYTQVESLQTQIQRLEAEGRVDEANTLRSTSVYQNNFGLYEQSRGLIRQANDTFRPLIRSDNESLDAIRQAKADREQVRRAIFRSFLDSYSE